MALPAQQSALGVLRPVRKGNNAAVASIIREVLTSYGCTGPGFAIHDPEVDHMFETYQLPRSAYFVIEHEGMVIGGGGVAPLKGGDPDVCELQKFYILEAYRGMGYGKTLLEASLQAAVEYGFRQCYLETLPFMKTATALYERAGFAQIDKPMGNTGHYGCDRWYVKAL